MDDWIASVVNAAIGPLRPLIEAISKRLSAVWSVISVFLGLVRTQWRILRGRVASWVDAQLRHALAVATTLRWIITTYIPRQLLSLAVSIKTWTGDLIIRLEAKAVSLFNGVMSWAGAHIKSALDSLNVLRVWAIAQFNSLLSTVGAMAKLVFGPLATPERLAEWIAAAMWDALVRFGRKNAHRVEAFIASQRAVIWRMVISVLEDVFTELL